jgi:hypothetical protein
MIPPVVVAPTPPTPPKVTDWAAVLTSKTFLGTVLATVVPLLTLWLNGTPPSITQIVTAIGVIVGAAGFRDWMGRIENYASAVNSGLAAATALPPVVGTASGQAAPANSHVAGYPSPR